MQCTLQPEDLHRHERQEGNRNHPYRGLNRACEPTATGDCCNYGGSYCTCVFQDTLDLNWKPYGELGGQNGYSTGATWGACGNENTGIDVYSEEGKAWI
jgi:hypothetical protein